MSSTTIYFLLVLAFLLWRFALGIKFEWQQINPLSPPSIFVRSFYSAFVFGTLGALLYVIRFYKLLHDIVVKTFDAWKLYNSIKAIIWVFLIYISYQYIVPWLFAILNTSVSVLYNIVGFVLYILPPLGISLIVAIIYGLWKTEQARKRDPK